MLRKGDNNVVYIAIARKRSLGQGNIFSSVCQEFCSQGGSTWAGTPGQVHPPDSYTPPGAVHAGRYGQQAGGTHPTGMHFCCNDLQSARCM